MKNKIAHLTVVATLSLSVNALAAGEAGGVTPASAPVAAASAVPAAKPEVPSPAAVQEPQTPAKRPASARHAKKKVRPKDLDLRHCLELKTNAEIAKCAGE